MANVTIYAKSPYTGAVTTNVVPDFDVSYWVNQGWSTTNPGTSTSPTPTPSAPVAPSGGKRFYRIGGDIYEDGTNRHIGPTEWNNEWSGRATEVPAPNSQPQAPTAPQPMGQTGPIRNSHGWTLEETLRQIKALQDSFAAGETQWSGRPLTAEFVKNEPISWLSDFYANLGIARPQTNDINTLLAGLQAHADRLGYNPAAGATFTPASTGNSQLDTLLATLQEYINGISESGQVINPAIELTPAEVQQFLDQATNEISPYYASQINAIKSDLGANLQALQKQYELTKQADEAQFKQTLDTSREQAAGAGLAFSGQRYQGERNLAQLTDVQQQQAALSASERARQLLAEGEQKLGTRNVSDLFGLGNFRLALPNTAGRGLFGTGGAYSPYVSPGSTVGSLEREQITAQQTRAAQLEEAARKARALNFYQ